MKISYGKLFKILVDRQIQKGDLCKMANIAPSTLSKLTKGESVNTTILSKICNALKVDVGDIMEMLPDKQE
jgi:DNA-binding Xre family transcriptional regulator